MSVFIAVMSIFILMSIRLRRRNRLSDFLTHRLAGTTVSGNVPVSGWALDDIEVEKVMIKRNSHPDDPSVSIGPDGLVLIGKAVFVKGARSDVEWDYLNYPLNDRAGWGCMVLTNYFPEQGNGEFVLSAFAHDKSGICYKTWEQEHHL